jgi:hypothetical protein
VCLSERYAQSHEQKLSPVLSSQASAPLEAFKIVKRVKEIEPSLSAWEALIGPFPRH